MAVSFSQVQVAIQTLIEQKKPLTLINLRSALGERGSMTTLSKYLQQWKSEHHLQNTQTVLSTPVQPAPDQIFSAVQNVWQEMVSLKDKELAEYQLFHEQECQKWIEEKNHYLHQIEHFKQLLRDLSDLSEHQKQEILNLSSQLQSQKEDYASLKTEYTRFQGQAQHDLSLKTQELSLLTESYHQQLAQLNLFNEKARQDLYTLEKNYTEALKRQSDHHESVYQKLQNSYYQTQIDLALAQKNSELCAQWDKKFSDFAQAQVLRSEKLSDDLQNALKKIVQSHPWILTPCSLRLFSQREWT